MRIKYGGSSFAIWWFIVEYKWNTSGMQVEYQVKYEPCNERCFLFAKRIV